MQKDKQRRLSLHKNHVLTAEMTFFYLVSSEKKLTTLKDWKINPLKEIKTDVNKRRK
jgi:hypothetical protein